jgi:ribosomal protein S21
MAINVTKKERETSQNLLHRFTKTVRQSGILLELRKGMFHNRPKSDLANKRSALRRVKVTAERKMAEKMSKPK